MNNTKKIEDWEDISWSYFSLLDEERREKDEEICKEVERLLAEGKDPNTPFYFGYVPASIRTVPLCRATECGYVKTVGKLLDAGADPNGTEDDYRPLYTAAEKGYVEIVRKLLAKGARVDDPGRPLLPDNALHAAARGCHVKIIKLLIDAGANVKAKNDRGKTPLHALAMSNCGERECLKVLQWLIDAGADIHAKDKQGGQPLHEAAQYGNVEMVKKLLELGANPWAETYDHLVPLALVPDDPLSPETKQDKEIRRVLLKAMKEHARKRSGQAKPKRVTPIKRVGRRKTDPQKLESERKVIDYS